MATSSSGASNKVPPPPPYYVDKTALHPGDYYQPLILNRIFELLLLMVNDLQKTAAAQAERLNFLTVWQQAYTEKINKIHVFAADNGDGNVGTTGAVTLSYGSYSVVTTVYTDSGAILPPGPLAVVVGANPGLAISDPATLISGAAGSTQIDGFAVSLDSGSNTDATTARGELNATNTGFTTQMQGYSQVVGNDAKALQTSVNQTNNEVQDQTDMATSILQQLSTILTSIYSSSG